MKELYDLIQRLFNQITMCPKVTAERMTAAINDQNIKLIVYLAEDLEISTANAPTEKLTFEQRRDVQQNNILAKQIRLLANAAAIQSEKEIRDLCCEFKHIIPENPIYTGLRMRIRELLLTLRTQNRRLACQRLEGLIRYAQLENSISGPDFNIDITKLNTAQTLLNKMPDEQVLY